MITIVTPAPYCSPYGNLYDLDMAKTEPMGVEALRKVLGPRLEKLKADGVHIVATKHGAAQGVVVPMEWYRRAREALKDPTDL
jgi:hypothetical protein